MAKQADEDHLLTVYADVHYYFTPPTAKPVHHRFDKGSFVYLFRNVNQGRGRLQVANHAGTPDQDAFSGYLDHVRLQHSQRHPTLCTLIVDDQGATGNQQSDGQFWHLPALDLQNEGRYMFKLHTIDLYFWTVQDADNFIESAKMILPPSQIASLDNPAQPQEQSQNAGTSTVVQKLENVTIGSTNPPQIQRSAVASPVGAGMPQSEAEDKQPHPAELPTAYAPLAYNPAAPPAPEPIKHREKTPPPPELGAETGSAPVAAHAPSQPHGMPPSQQPYSIPPPPPNQALQQPFSGQPQHHASNSGSAPPVSPYPVSQPSPAPSASPHPPPQGSGYFPPRQPQGQSGQTAPAGQYVQQPFTPSAQTPGGNPYATAPTSPQPGAQQGPYQPPYNISQPQQGQTQQQPHPGYTQQPNTYPSIAQPSGQVPVGGYSNYHQYGQAQQGIPPNDPSAVHGQAYQPTGAEAGSSQHKPANIAAGTRFEGQAAKLEKGVGRLFKKLEKRIG